MNKIPKLLYLDYSFDFVVGIISFLYKILYQREEESLVSNFNHEEFVREKEKHNLYSTRIYWFYLFS